MVTLGPDLLRQRASRVNSCFETIEHVAEIIVRVPVQILASSLIDIHPVDAGKHLPAPTRILRFVIRDSLLHYLRRAHPQVTHIIKLKWSSCRNNKSPETNQRSLLDGEQMSFDDISNVHAPVKILICFGVGVIIGLANRPVVVFFWKESRGSEDDARQSLIAVE